MNKNQKGFVAPLVVIIMAFFVIGGGVSLYLQKHPVSNNKTISIKDTCNDQTNDKTFNSKGFSYDGGVIYKQEGDGTKNTFLKIINSEELGKRSAKVSFPEKGNSALVLEYLYLGMDDNVLKDIYLVDLESKATTTLPIFTDSLGKSVEHEYYLSPNSKCVVNMSVDGKVNPENTDYNRVLSIYNTKAKKWSKITDWPATNYFDDKYFLSWSADSSTVYLNDHVIHGSLSVNDTNPTIYHNDLLFINDVVYGLDIDKKSFGEYVTTKDICSTAREVQIYSHDSNWVLANCFSEKNGVKYTTYELTNLQKRKISTLGTFPMFGSNQRGFIDMWPEAEKIIFSK